jgi:hypothetical protein
VRILVGFLGIVAIAAFGGIYRLPDRAECGASGRVVEAGTHAGAHALTSFTAG